VNTDSSCHGISDGAALGCTTATEIRTAPFDELAHPKATTFQMLQKPAPFVFNTASRYFHGSEASRYCIEKK